MNTINTISERPLNLISTIYNDSSSNNSLSNLVINNKIDIDVNTFSGNKRNMISGDNRNMVSIYNEWKDCDYTFNKHNTKNLPMLNLLAEDLIQGYFNLYPLESKKQSKRDKRKNRLSLNRIFVSNASVKHNNDSVYVTFYVYNRMSKYYYFKLKSIKGNMLTLKENNKRKINKRFFKKSKLNTYKKIKLTRTNIFNKRISVVNTYDNFLLKRSNRHRSLIIRALKWDTNNFSSYKTKYYKSYLKKLHTKHLLSLYYMKMLHNNNDKFKAWFTLGIKNLLSNIYKKNVELNIVNLKYLHYNSDNISKAIVLKLKNRKNRLLKVLKRSKRLVKVPTISPPSTIKLSNDNTKMRSNYEYNKIIDITKRDISSSVLNIIKYKAVSGFRVETMGRLSKRLTASRSVFKYKYVGSLKNIYSSYRNTSCSMARGHVKSNMQFTKVDSKTRNGAYGLKGWISSY